jgi:hypothetical protein
VASRLAKALLALLPPFVLRRCAVTTRARKTVTWKATSTSKVSPSAVMRFK